MCEFNFAKEECRKCRHLTSYDWHCDEKGEWLPKCDERKPPCEVYSPMDGIIEAKVELLWSLHTQKVLNAQDSIYCFEYCPLCAFPCYKATFSNYIKTLIEEGEI